MSKNKKCPTCNGSGRRYMPGDCHKSGGIIPCDYRWRYEYCDRGNLKKRTPHPSELSENQVNTSEHYDRYTTVRLRKLLMLAKKHKK